MTLPAPSLTTRPISRASTPRSARLCSPPRARCSCLPAPAPARRRRSPRGCAHLLFTRKAWPSEILSVTFTNKAAREMRERVGRLVGDAVEGMPWLGTFHAIGAKMLRRHAELVGLQSNFTILDTDDQLRLLKQLILAADLDEKRWPARQLAGLIDQWKNKGLTPADIDAGESELYANGRGREMYAQYQARLKALNACDFGDLLLHMLTILKRDRDVLARLSAPLQIYPGGRISGHQQRPVSLAPPARAGAQEHLLRRRRRPVDLFRGAARRWTTS